MWHRVFRSVTASRFRIVVLVSVASILVVGLGLAGTDYFLKINKSIDVFGRVYKEITLNYVDEIEPERLMRSGVEGMLDELDPYTNFIGEGEGGEIELLTTGKYGGIGITIGVRDGYITVTGMMEGYAAQRQGVQIGDRIIEVEGKTLIGVKPGEVRSLTRGEPGTPVHLKIEREGESRPLDFTLIREEIILKNISYSDYISEGIGYIKIDRFSRGAGEELRQAIKDLRLRGAITGLILDLRENPGGLLDMAVEVVDKFVPRGSLVVSTRGRKPESERKYTAQEEPVLPSEPVVVLVNRSSASASEIVAGALQDLDRGVILGTRTFGKGLVQTVTPLVYSTELKITTAKYYTPSGRCIQEIDYMHKSRDGLFTVKPDSLRREFRTTGGRKVFEAGGITPDTTVDNPEPPTIVQELLRKSLFFKFATQVKGQHPEQPSDSVIERRLIDEFRIFTQERLFTYQEKSEAKLKELREAVEKSNYGDTVRLELDKLSRMLELEKERGFERNKKEILRTLKIEIAARYAGEKGRIRATLPDDIQIRVATALLKTKKSYEKILAGR